MVWKKLCFFTIYVCRVHLWKKVQKWIFLCFQFSMLNINHPYGCHFKGRANMATSHLFAKQPVTRCLFIRWKECGGGGRGGEGWTWRNGGAVEGADVGNILRAQTGGHKLSHVLQWGHTCRMAASRGCTHMRFLALRHGAHHHGRQVGILWDVQYLQKLRHLGSALEK